MKALQLIIYSLLFFLCRVSAQNLVRNSGMDSSNYCPAFLGDLLACQFWTNANGNDADYFHLCRPGLAPNNFTGWQAPHSDSAYCGFTAFIYYTTNISSRDYLRGELISPLESGKKYCFRYYISLSDSSNVAVANIGIYFSQNDPTMLTDSIGNPNLFYLPYTPVYEPPRLQKDTAGWMEISGEFIAQGGELFLTIGNFRQDINTTWDTIRPIPPFVGVGAYYYVDDVSVELCEDTIPPPPPPPVEPVSALSAPNGFSPNGDGINDLFTVKYNHIAAYRCSIFNRWGNLLWQTTDAAAGWNGTYHGQDVPEGTYFYLIEATGVDGKVYLLKGFLMLVR